MMEFEVKQEPPLEIDTYELANVPGDLDSSIEPDNYEYARTDSPSRARKRRLCSESEYDYLMDETNSSNDEMHFLLRQWGLEGLTDRFTKNLIDVSLLDYIVEVDILDLCKGLPMRYRLVLRHKLRQKSYRKQRELGLPERKVTGRTKSSANIVVQPLNSVPVTPQQEQLQLIDTPVPKSPTPSQSSVNEVQAHVQPQSTANLTLNEFVKAMLDTAPLEPPNDDFQLASPESFISKRNVDVAILDLDRLLATIDGLHVVHYFREHNQLDKHYRGKLLKLIIEKLAVQIPIRDINSHWYNEIHKEVVRRFPSEEKFHDSYVSKLAGIKYNVSKKMRSGLRKINPPASSMMQSISEFSESDMAAAKKWLKYGREPWEEIMKQWDMSYVLRRQDCASMEGRNIGRLWEENYWPILEQAIGADLISHDFQRIFTTGSDIFEKWPVMIEKVFSYCKRHMRNARYKNIIREYEEGGKSNDVKFTQILCGLLPPGLVNKNYKPNNQEIERGFVHVTTHDIERSMELYRAQMMERNLTVQPHVIAVLQDQRYFAYVDTGRMYVAKSLLHAIDTVFKTIMVMNAAFPAEARAVWAFVQKYCYELSTPRDRTFQSVVALLSELT